MAAERRITKSQTRAIRARQRTMGMDDASYRATLQARYQVLSTLELSVGQANDLLNFLYGSRPAPRRRQRVVNPCPPPAAPQACVVRVATGPQRQLIEALVAEIAWENADGYARWLKRTLGLERVASSVDAMRTIEGLKGLKRHGHGHRG